MSKHDDDPLIPPETVQVMAQLMATLQQLGLPSPDVAMLEKRRVLVARYALSDKMAGGRHFLAGTADKLVAELVNHELAGREVVQWHDEHRSAWVYEVYERISVEVPREAAQGGHVHATSTAVKKGVVRPNREQRQQRADANRAISEAVRRWNAKRRGGGGNQSGAEGA